MRLKDRIFGAVPRYVTGAVIETMTRKKTLMLMRELQARATVRSCEIVEREMPDATLHKSKADLIATTAQGLRDGVVAEFGVHEGHTINKIAAALPSRTVHGFDSFRGLPETWGGYRSDAGQFDRAGEPPKVASNVSLHIGWFDDTVPPFFADVNEPVALLHIDCDIYSSTRCVLEAAAPHLVAGSRIIFDEYFNYPGFEQHERRAWLQCAEAHGLTARFFGYSGEQAALEIVAIAAQDGARA